MLSHVERAGALPEEDTPSRIAMPGDIAADGTGDDYPDHLLPALLRSAEKRALNILFDWPWITQKDVAGLLGVSAARVSQMVASLEEFGLVSSVAEAGSPPGADRPRARAAGPQGPRVLGRCEEALEHIASSTRPSPPRGATCPGPGAGSC